MIGIVILNYNEWDILIDCINSIRETCKKEKYRVYLVDNNSSIEMSSGFKQYLKVSDDICFIENKNNKGYSAGNNVGIGQALRDNCDFILISNNDVIYKDNAIYSMKSFLTNNSEYGIVGPKIYTPNGKIQEINMGCKMTLRGKYLFLLRKTPFRFLSDKFVDTFQAKHQDMNYPFDVYAVSGCCFMLTKTTCEKMFPFDENTFLYEEENIIGTRMEILGLKTCYNTDSEVIHLGGASTKGFSSFSYKCLVESEIYYCMAYLKKSILQIFPLYVMRSLVYIARYGIKDFSAYLKDTISKMKKKKRFD